MDPFRQLLNEGQEHLASAQRLLKKLSTKYGIPESDDDGPDDFLTLRNNNGGEFGLYFNKYKPQRFLKRCRMSRKCFNFVVDGLVRSGHLQESPNISAQEKVYIALQHLHGVTFDDLTDRIVLSPRTISSICKNVYDSIWKTFQPHFLPEPNEFTWESVMQEYYTAYGIPNCIGALDSKHVRIRRPAHCGYAFFNYKYYHSLVLQAVARPNLQFVAIDVGFPGSMHDDGVFAISNLLGHLEACQSTREYLLPESDIMCPMYLIGDAAYPLDRYLIKPYPQQDLTDADRAFNKTLSGARASVERAFGFLRNKFPIFDMPINMNLQDILRLIASCCVLQNMIIDIDGSDYTPPKDKTFIDRNDYSLTTPTTFQSGETVRKVVQENLRARDG